MDFWGQSSYYRPVALGLYKLVGDIWGIQPVPFHACNVLLHAVASGLVYLLGRKVFPQQEKIALLAAVFFAVMPVHTEAVNWVACSGDILTVVFGAAAGLAWLSERPKTAWILLLLAACSKETALLLGVVALVHAKQTERPIRPLLLGLTTCAAAYLALRFGLAGIAFRGSGHFREGMAERFLRAPELFMRYILLCIWPYPMNLHRCVTIRELQPAWVAGGWIATLLIAAATFKYRKHTAAMCVVWFTITMLPVLNMVPLPMPLAERSAYLASVGFCWLLAMALRNHLAPALILIAAWTWATTDRHPDWVDEVRLFRNTVQLAPHSQPAHLELGRWLVEQGSYGEGARVLQALLEVDPTTPSYTYTFLAEALRNLKQPDAAWKVLQQALQNKAQPEPPIYVALGTLLEDKKLYEQAIQTYDRANHPDGRFRKSVVLAKLNRIEEALRETEALVRDHPEQVKAKKNLEVLRSYASSRRSTE